MRKRVVRPGSRRVATLAAEQDSARRHFQIALGSACKALSLALLARDLGLLTSEAYFSLEQAPGSVRRVLVRLIQRTHKSC